MPWINDGTFVTPAVLARAFHGGRQCGLPLADVTCTRALQHPGRHMRIVWNTDERRDVTHAWPGETPPTEKDLEN